MPKICAFTPSMPRFYVWCGGTRMQLCDGCRHRPRTGTPPDRRAGETSAALPVFVLAYHHISRQQRQQTTLSECVSSTKKVHGTEN